MTQSPMNAVLEVALPVPLAHSFHYLPPPGTTADGGWLGCRIRAPFAGRELVGIVVAVHNDIADIDASLRDRLRPASARIDATPLLDDELYSSLQWAANYYQRPLGDVLNQALPGLLREGQPLPEPGESGWHLLDDASVAVDQLRAGTRPRQLAEWLQQHGPRRESELELFMPAWRDALRRLKTRGWVEALRLERSHPRPALSVGPTPNPEQQVAIDAICQQETGTSSRDGFSSFLLDGVTGSGKTEVYLRAIDQCLARGRQALVLVPEIGLTPQLLRRFAERLPVPVVISHSAMNDGERLRAWAAMSRGEARVLLGTRSAVFTPLPEAGLIVIDEEHDASYKQQDGFRYHARDLALVRAKALHIPIVLGSATPSFESLQLAHDGRHQHLRLRQRAGAAKPPVVRVVDVRHQRLRDGLSEPAALAIGEHLARGKQVLVFRNRRGYAPVLLCHDCGWSARCRHCEAALTVHARGGRLICHHCGARQSAPPACPDCGSLGLQPQGAGTERLEQTLAERFPEVPLVRVDRETTRGRDALAAHFETLGDKAGILVGTQMLAKGHDLPHLTLVIVVGVDEGLFSADFRAAERLAQLLIQVSGRAGRADAAGEVLLQTHHPEHPQLLALLSRGYHGFADEALAERQAAELPPFGYLALLRAESRHGSDVDAFLLEARTRLPASITLQVHGPMPAPMPRRQGRMRAQLLLSCAQRGPLHQTLRPWVRQLYDMPSARKVRWSLDIDPQDLF